MFKSLKQNLKIKTFVGTSANAVKTQIWTALGENKRLHRLTHSKPLVDAFFDWVDRQFEQQGLLPSNPLTKALSYVRERRAGLEVFLGDPDVPMDTNHLERALRAIAMTCS